MGLLTRMIFLGAIIFGAAWSFIVTIPPKKPPCQIAFLGDSIFSGMEVAALPPPLSEGCNLSKSGAIVANIVPDGLQKSARIVFLQGGINDMLDLKSDEEISASYRKAIALLAPRRVFMLGVIGVEEHLVREDYIDYVRNERIRRLNADLRAVCAAFPHCNPTRNVAAIDLSGRTSDGIHITKAGYTELGRLMLADMEGSAQFWMVKN